MSSTFNSINTDLYSINTSPFITILEELITDISLGTVQSDLYYSTILDTSYNPSNTTNTDNSNSLIELCLSLISSNNLTSLSSTFSILKFVSTVNKIYTDFNSVNTYLNPYNTFISASNSNVSLNDSEIFNETLDTDSLYNLLFSLSIYSATSSNISATIPRLQVINTLMPDNNVTELLYSIASTNSYYSNNFIELYLANIANNLEFFTSELINLISGLPVYTGVTFYVTSLNLLSSYIVTEINNILTVVTAISLIYSRLNFSSNSILLLQQINDNLQAISLVNNLNLIYSGFSTLQLASVDTLKIQHNALRINSILNSNFSESEINLINKELSESYIIEETTDFDMLSASISDNLKSYDSNIIYRPDVYPSVQLVIAACNISTPIVQTYYNDLINCNNGLNSAIGSLNTIMQSVTNLSTQINSHFVINISLVKALSGLFKTVSNIINKINAIICKIKAFLCLAEKLLTMGLGFISNILSTGLSVLALVQSSEAKISAVVGNLMNLNIKAVATNIISGVLATTKAALLAEIGSVVSGGSAAVVIAESLLASVTPASIISALNLPSALNSICLSNVAGTITAILASSLASTKCSAYPGLTSIKFPIISLPVLKLNLSLPKFNINPSC